MSQEHMDQSAHGRLNTLEQRREAMTSNDIANPLQGKVALVTGANRGIGAEICRGLAHAGAPEVAAYRDPEWSRDLVEAIANYLKEWNESPRPFVWTATVESIMEKIDRARATLDEIKPGWAKRKRRKKRR